MARFITGPDVNPFARASRGIEMLEAITPIELASAVPFVKITRIDNRTGAPDTTKRPLMFDLIQGPKTESLRDERSFMERSLVSLTSLSVDTTLSYGFMMFRKVSMEFIVHQPAQVFDRNTRLAYRDLLEAGNSFSLEYGWNGVIDSLEPRWFGMKNPLFSGDGFFDNRTGLVVPATETVLLVVYQYTTRLTANGEVAMTINAIENGDIALREARFSDSVDGVGKWDSSRDDREAADHVLSAINGIKTQPAVGRGELLRFGDVMDATVAPLVDAACTAFGYSGVDMYLGNFNPRAGKQQRDWGGLAMDGRSIADFLVPKKLIVDRLSQMATKGRALMLRNFVNDMISFTLSQSGGWAQSAAAEKIDRPNVALGSRTLVDRSTGKCRLVLYIFDRMQNVRTFSNDPVDERDFIDVELQTRERIFRKLDDKGVSIIEFGRGNSMILDAAFEFTPDPLFQAILIDTAYRDVKDRATHVGMPDVESRVGHADPKEIIPFSTLKGEITMVGNFVLESFAKVWVEFFGASDISGIFHVIEKHDTLQPGSFVTRVTLQSEGIDPMNTRRKRGGGGRSDPGRQVRGVDPGR